MLGAPDASSLLHHTHQRCVKVLMFLCDGVGALGCACAGCGLGALCYPAGLAEHS